MITPLFEELGSESYNAYKVHIVSVQPAIVTNIIMIIYQSVTAA